MSMQISVDPAALSQEQREAVAGFILAYPGSAGTCHDHAVAEIPAFIHKDTADAGLVEVGRTIAPAVNELEVLQHDHESTLPVAAFGQPVVDEAAAAFGVPPAPLPLGATAAPSTAVVAQFPSAPAAMPGTSAAPTSSVPAPPAPTPANVAPIAAPPTGSPVGGVELDKHGLPWDARIHVGTKRKNTDGSWTAKRGVDPALVATVEAELRQVMGAAPAAPLAPAGSTPTPTSAPVAAVPPPPPAPVAGAAPSMPAAPSAAPGEVPVDARQQFVGLVGRASAAIQGGKVTQAEVNQICADSGIPALPLLANRLDLVATVASRIDALIAARGQ